MAFQRTLEGSAGKISFSLRFPEFQILEGRGALAGDAADRGPSIRFGARHGAGVNATWAFTKPLCLSLCLFVCLHKQRHEQTHGMKKMLAPFLFFFTNLNTMHMLHDVRLFSVTCVRCFFQLSAQSDTRQHIAFHKTKQNVRREKG